MAALWVFFVPYLILSATSLNLTVNNETTYVRYPGDFQCTGEPVEWEVNVPDEGIGVIIFVNQTNLDPENGEHLVLSAEKSMSGENASVTYLTGSLEDIPLAIPLTNRVYMRFSSFNECSPDLSFTLNLRQYEEAVPLPPPTPPNPYPPTGIKTEILIFLEGKTVNEFKDEGIRANFRKAIQEVAFNFCIKNKIEYNPNKLDNETVFLRNEKECPSKWHSVEPCLSVMMSVYVTDPGSEYQLSVPHLEQLWEQIQQDGLPISLGIKPYESPDVAVKILMWMLWIFIAIFITFALGYFFWRIEKNSTEIVALLKEDEERRRKSEIFRGVELRRKNPQQLQLSKHQKIPEFMLSNGDAASVLSTPPATKKHVMKPILRLPPPTETPPAIINITTPSLDSPTSPPPYTGHRPLFFGTLNLGFDDDGDDGDESEEISQL